MKKIAAEAIRSVFGNMDPYKKDNTFEVLYLYFMNLISQIFGLDYMIDDEYKIYLIECNTNPCFEISSTLLARIIPNMIENALRLLFLNQNSN